MSTFIAITTTPENLMAGDVVLSTSRTVFHSIESGLTRKAVKAIAKANNCQFVKGDYEVAIHVKDSEQADSVLEALNA